MNPFTRSQLDNIRSVDRHIQGRAYTALLEEAAQPVEWAYEAWDELVAALAHRDNRLRSIAAQLLCRLGAHSDPKARIVGDLDRLLAVTRDEKFVTARHALQSLWQIGTAGVKQKKRLIDAFAARYAECAREKNGTLIRYDIIQALRRLYDAAPDEKLRKLTLSLIETEPDLKYRSKYATLWKV